MEDFLAENGAKRRPEIEAPGASAALTGASA